MTDENNMLTPAHLKPTIPAACDHCGKAMMLCPQEIEGLIKGTIKGKFCSEECWVIHTEQRNMLNAINPNELPN